MSRKASTARSLCCIALVSGADGCLASAATAFSLEISSTTVFGFLGDLFLTAGFFVVVVAAAAALLHLVAGSAPVSSPDEVVAALRLRQGVTFFAAGSSDIPCVVSAAALLPTVSGGDKSSFLDEGGELGGIVLSLVLRRDSCCCARWAVDGIFGEPEGGERFFGGIGVRLLCLVGMIAALCEMRESRDGYGVSMDGQRLCLDWNVRGGV